MGSAALGPHAADKGFEGEGKTIGGGSILYGSANDLPAKTQWTQQKFAEVAAMLGAASIRQIVETWS